MSRDGAAPRTAFAAASTGATAAVTPSLLNLLAGATTFMYQIQDLDAVGSVGALQASSYPLLVLDPVRFTQGKEAFDTREMVRELRSTAGGQRRVLLAYIDIGEAENYRTYWQSNWKAPTATTAGSPDFLVTLDPNGWSGNFPVAYWDSRWKALWTGPNGMIAQLAADGFDGIYLDWVEAYDDSAVAAAAQAAGVDPASAMMDFIEQLRSAGQQVNPSLLVVPQNAPYLLDADPARYLRDIDALAVEDTWFSGTGDANWGEPRGGDVANTYMDRFSTAALLPEYRKYLSAGKPVFSVDYCLQDSNAAYVYTAARKAGLFSLVTQVALSQLTSTPPPALPLFTDLTAVDPAVGSSRRLTLGPGLNLVSIPALPEGATTYDSAALARDTGATIVARLAQPPDVLSSGFQLYAPQLASRPFPLAGNQGYVVSVARSVTVTYWGAPWPRAQLALELAPGLNAVALARKPLASADEAKLSRVTGASLAIHRGRLAGAGPRWLPFVPGLSLAPSPLLSSSAYFVSVSAAASVSVTPLVDATDMPPTAMVPTALTATASVPFTLSASTSDPDGDPLAYAWQVASGPSVPRLIGAATPSITFTPTVPGTYTLRFVADDGRGGIASATATVLVTGR